ncbi:hypothetical protein MTO96_000782 [Rhipicephalus appendiculatus]
MGKKRLAITYPGYEPDYAATNSVSKKRLQTSYREHGLKGKLAAKKCSRDVYRHRETASSSQGCLFLVFLFFNPTCLDTKELQVEALALTLRQHLVGQDIAVNRTVTAIARYLNSSESAASVPLVLVYVGCSGCGKTYASSLIAKHYPYTEALVASHKIALTRKTGNDLLHWLRYSLSSWRPNVIVIDDIDLGLNTVRPIPLDDPI